MHKGQVATLKNKLPHNVHLGNKNTYRGQKIILAYILDFSQLDNLPDTFPKRIYIFFDTKYRLNVLTNEVKNIPKEDHIVVSLHYKEKLDDFIEIR